MSSLRAFLELGASIGSLAGHAFPKIFFSSSQLLPLVLSCGVSNIVWFSAEALRWQTYPSFLSILLLMVSQSSALKERKRLALTMHIIGMAASLLSGVSLILFPFVQIPKPTGSYSVGTKEFDWKDPDRPMWLENYPDSKIQKSIRGDKFNSRHLTVKSYYPTSKLDDEEPGAPEQETILTKDEVLIGLTSFFGVPNFLLSHIKLVKTHTFLQVPHASGKFPVLIFSHGYGGIHSHNTILCSELASHGYIVLSIAHPGDGNTIVFSDKTVALFDTDIYNLGWHLDEDSKWKLRNYQLDIRTKDVSFVLDQLERLNQEGIFKEHLDLDNIGIFGHSFGGSSSVLAGARESKRVKACLSLDGWMWPINSTEIQNFTCPLAFINAEQNKVKLHPGAAFNDKIRESLIHQLGSKGHNLYIHGSLHHDFHDFAFLLPIMRLLGATGSIDKLRMVHLLNGLTLEFFDKNLKEHKNVNLTPLLVKYPEIEFFRE